MLPEEIYASSASSQNFRYSHPLNHLPVDDGSMRARLAYDLMTFMKRSDCPYFIHPDRMSTYDPHQSDDEVDIMIVDGFYKEADLLVAHRLEINPRDDKALFQKAFIQHLREQYEKLLDREEKVLLRDPRNVNALLNKGFALANLGREEEALAAANAALRIDPDNLQALGNKAYIAKALCRDDLREQTLAHAYNVRAREREAALARQESRLLQDFRSVFMDVDTPSAFEEFNRLSGVSDTVH
ncbi:MAG: hypothetical protein KDI13_04205 [Alphaproteobacteria bacterium]|nr:hypothetical protein [Alphaproteobacteria bacterium]